MLNRIASALIVAAMAAVFALFQLKMIAPGDAFFIAVAIVVVFTGQQLIAREHMSVGEAATSILTPGSWRSRMSFAAYIVCLALGAVMTAQAFAFI